MTVTNGYVPTPAAVADYVAAIGFGRLRPSEVTGGGRLLLPGLGTGNLYAGVRRYCTVGENWVTPEFGYDLPECVGVEMDGNRLSEFHDGHPDAQVDVVEADFLLDPPEGTFDWAVMNPPYTRYKEIPAEKRERYADRFELATGTYPLQILFVEQALRLLDEGGDLTVILPTSVFSTGETEQFRDLLRTRFVGPITYLPEPTFDVTVETVVLTIRKGRAESYGNSLWVEPLRRYEARQILARLGVADMEAALADYYRDYERVEQMVRNRDQFERRKRDVENPRPLGHTPIAGESGASQQQTLEACLSGGD